jgi:hypothetical protein
VIRTRVASIIPLAAACLAGLAVPRQAPGQIAPEPPRRLPDPLGQRVGVEGRPRATFPPDVRIDADWIAERVRRLDDPSLEVRDTATLELIAAAVTPEQLAEHARAPGLSPEVRERLTHVAQQWFATTERAALGVSFGYVRDDARTAAITDTIRGFDAARVLQPGDVIAAVNGEPVTYQQLRAQIVSHDPGQSCTLTIVRGGRTMTAAVTFGRWSDLASGRGFVDENVFVRALAIRLLRAGWPVPEPVSATLDATGWAHAARLAARARAAEQDAVTTDENGVVLRPTALVRVGGQGAVRGGEAEREADAGSLRVWRRLSDEALMRERDLMKMQLDQLRNEVGRMGLDPGARQRILDALQDRIRQIDRELARRRP